MFSRSAAPVALPHSAKRSSPLPDMTWIFGIFPPPILAMRRGLQKNICGFQITLFVAFQKKVLGEHAVGRRNRRINSVNASVADDATMLEYFGPRIVINSVDPPGV